MVPPFSRLAGSNAGSAMLMGMGAASGAAVALSGLYLLARCWIDPWLEALPERDTDMFGRPEGWLVAIVAILFGPLIVLLAAWVGVRCARNLWDLDRGRLDGVRFVVLALPLGLLSFGSIDALGTGGALVIVSIGVGLAGFVAAISARHTPDAP